MNPNTAHSIQAAKNPEQTILLVEDENSLRELCVRYLTFLGYKVLVAERPEEALELAARHPDAIHLLLTDVVMPGMNGRELAQRLQSSNPQLVCLFMSGYSAEILSRRGILDKDVKYLLKPFSRTTLAAKLLEVLEHSASNRKAAE